MQKNTISYLTANCVTKLFGTLPDGKAVHSYTLSNANGMEVTFINYGAAITSLIIPGATGRTDVVLGFSDIDDYIDAFNLPSAPYFGSVIGRYAGRISNAAFNLNGVEHKLNANNGANTLHGGTSGFGRAFWEMEQLRGGESPSITFSYTSRDGEEHFPGELGVTVTYTVTADNELTVAYKATTTKDTVLNLTQHSYFNLEGHTQSISGQELFVNASQMLEVKPDGIPTGALLGVKDTENDFTQARRCPQSIDNSFVVPDDGTPAATLYSAVTGLKMTVFTNQPSVHIYVGGNCFGKVQGKEGASYHTTSGICFEAQNYPAAPNQHHFPNSILRSGEVYDHKTRFIFEYLK